MIVREKIDKKRLEDCWIWVYCLEINIGYWVDENRLILKSKSKLNLEWYDEGLINRNIRFIWYLISLFNICILKFIKS